MLIFREERWGQVVFDPDGDEFWGEIKAGASDPRIDRPLSVTCRLNRFLRLHGLSGQPLSDTWLRILDRLCVTGILRLNLEGIESIPRSDSSKLARAACKLKLGVVASAADCTPDLERCFGFPAGVGLQVLFDPGRAWRLDRAGGFPLSRRFELLHGCVNQGLRVRVLTKYDPFSPMALAEFGEELTLAGVRDWLILPPDRAYGEAPLIDAALEEIRGLRQDLPWLEIRYGSFLEREFGLAVYPDGSVLAKESPAKPALRGTVNQLAAGKLLSQAFLDRHIELWVNGPLILERTPGDLTREVFLSYNREDRDFVISLAERLEGSGIRTWFDEKNLEAGERWQLSTQKALERSPVVLIFVGPHGVGRVQQIEVETTIDRATRDEVRLIPVILPGVEDPIPTWLRSWQYVDFRREGPDPFQRLLQGIHRREETPSEDDPATAASPFCADTGSSR